MIHRNNRDLSLLLLSGYINKINYLCLKRKFIFDKEEYSVFNKYEDKNFWLMVNT